MKKVILLLVTIFLAINFARSQNDVTYQETLNRMFKVSGSEATYLAAITQMFVMLKEQKNIPEQVLADLEKEFLQTSSAELVNMLTPVYEKHLTEADLYEIIKFYDSPTGKKFAGKTPVIMQESMQIGQQWGQKIGQDFLLKLKEKGY